MTFRFSYRTLHAPATTLAVAAVALLTIPAAAQDWKAGWDKIVAAANEEGALVMSSQPNQQARDFLHREWAKAYPKIKLSLSVIPAPQLIARLRTERAAGKYLWDLAVSGAGTGYLMSKEGVLDPVADEFVFPDIKDPATWGGWDRVYFDTARKYVFAISATLKSPYFNTARIPLDKVERMGLKVLLDPEYRGKIVWHDPATPGSGQSFAYILRSRLGDEGLRKLIVDQRTTFVAGQHEVIEALARETAWIGIGPFATALMKPYHDAGLKVQVRSFGNAPEVNEMSIGGAALYVYNRRPHPNASRVFVNWVLSKEIQHGLAQVMLQDSRRMDLASVSEPERVPLRGGKYLETQREEHERDVIEAGKFVTEIRRSVR
jgi:iron(III) transport system substrate-binding protein